MEIIGEAENEIPEHAEYITTKKFNKVPVENFTARSTQAGLVNKTDFDNKLISSKRKITSNKTKQLEVLKKLNSPKTEDYNVFLSKRYFTSNDGFQNAFVYQPTVDTC